MLLADLAKLTQPALATAVEVLREVLVELFTDAPPQISDSKALRRRWQAVCKIVARQNPNAQVVAKAFEDLNPSALLTNIRAGQPEVVHAKAEELHVDLPRNDCDGPPVHRFADTRSGSARAVRMGTWPLPQVPQLAVTGRISRPGTDAHSALRLVRCRLGVSAAALPVLRQSRSPHARLLSCRRRREPLPRGDLRAGVSWLCQDDLDAQRLVAAAIAGR